MLNDNVNNYGDKIYKDLGYESQMDKLREEFAELHLALVRFLVESIAENLELLKEEIGDYEFVKSQINRNVATNKRILFMRKLIEHESFLIKEELKQTFDNVKNRYSEDINKIVKGKAIRTLERIQDGKYIKNPS